MQLEVQMALNFVISYMYNKLPRRRVNIFGEELEKALRLKFQGHWYPNKPMKGSAYRCLKTGDPIDPVLEIAARQAGLELREIRENLPEDLAVWVDPGEVSYRIGEKGQIKILYSEASDIVCHEENLDKEVTKTFNPEAQCFNPIDNLSSAMSNISLSPKSSSPYSSNSPTPPFKPREASPVAAAFMQKCSAPLTFTIASFAQTKFGSTKLKSNSKRVNRMSPTEFSHYIKQRQMIQQQQLQNYSLQNPQQLLTQQSSTIGTSLPIGSTSNLGSAFAAVSSSRPQSLSPNQIDNVLFQNSNASTNQLYNPWGRGMLDPSVFSLQNAFNDVIPSNNQSGSKYHVFDQAGSGLMPAASNSSGAPASSAGHPADQLSNLNDGLTNIYPQSQYQHLLVAN